MKTRVICLGNETLRDDGVAISVAEELRRRAGEGNGALDVVESAVAGYDLLELLDGWDRVIFVEAVQLADRKPGEVVRLDPLDSSRQLRLCSLREATIAEVLAAGAKLGRSMPSDLVLLGVQGEDLCSFGSELSPLVAEAVPRVADQVLAEASRTPDV